MFGLSEDDILRHVGSDIILRNIVKQLGVNAVEAHVTNTTVTNHTAGIEAHRYGWFFVGVDGAQHYPR